MIRDDVKRGIVPVFVSDHCYPQKGFQSGQCRKPWLGLLAPFYTTSTTLLFLISTLMDGVRH